MELKLVCLQLLSEYPASRPYQCLTLLLLFHGCAAMIKTRRGQKFTCRALDQRDYSAALSGEGHLQLGMLTQNGFIGHFLERFCNEYLNEV